ncbi:MAG: protein kinase [Polyangiales bacterium]
MSDPTSLVGLTLADKYMVRRLLGVGGMGSVYEGLNVELGKRVAIKTIDRAHAQAEELATRLRREARAAAAIESEHIVQVFDVGDDPRVGVFMVMELLSGEDLAARLDREHRLDPAVAVTIAHQIARALAKAHIAGVVHRDLKPANLFLVERDDSSLFVKILDFGISKIVTEELLAGARESRGLTRLGSAIGTPQYMSPEQAQGLPTIDHRTDVWALGCVLFEMIAGRAPYEEQPTYELTIVRILTTAPPQLTDLAPHCPPAIAAVVANALQHDWARRIPDCATFARMLVEAASGTAADPSGRGAGVGGPILTPSLGMPSPFMLGGSVQRGSAGPIAVAPNSTRGQPGTLLANPSPFDVSGAANPFGATISDPAAVAALMASVRSNPATSAVVAMEPRGGVYREPEFDAPADELEVAPRRGRGPLIAFVVALSVAAAAMIGVAVTRKNATRSPSASTRQPGKKEPSTQFGGTGISEDY